MYRMFANTHSFNHSIGNFDLSSVTDMREVFDGASSLSSANKGIDSSGPFPQTLTGHTTGRISPGKLTLFIAG